MRRLAFTLLVLFVIPLSLFASPFQKSTKSMTASDFPYPLSMYNDQDLHDTWAQLQNRIGVDPVNLVATCVFILAIIHTFMAHKLSGIATKFYRRADEFTATAL